MIDATSALPGAAGRRYRRPKSDRLLAIIFRIFGREQAQLHLRLADMPFRASEDVASAKHHHRNTPRERPRSLVANE